MSGASDDNTGYRAEQYGHNYPDGIEHHYWNICRNRLVHRLLVGGPRATTRSVQDAGMVLDIGAGRGIVVDFLRRRGLDCWGCDVAASRPIAPRVAPFLMTETDALQLEQAFRSKVSAILLLDVLEHLLEPTAFLRSCRHAFSGVERVVVTLPARQELWSNYDEYYGHFARYNIQRARDMLEAGGFELVDIGYFFHGLYPPARFLSALNISRQTEVQAPRSPLAVAIHRLLGHAFQLESLIVPRRVPGSSLYVLASPRLTRNVVV